jgi:hypothetical protein
VAVLFALIISLVACLPAKAEELDGGQLYAFCTSTDAVASAACRFFILGAVTGISMGDGSTKGKEGQAHYVERKKTHFCMPDDMPQDEMVNVFVITVRMLVMKYPEDLKEPAIALVDAAMHNRFPCPP